MNLEEIVVMQNMENNRSLDSEMDLSVLEEASLAHQEDDSFSDDEDETELEEAIVLIRRAGTVLDYVSDPDLCKTISKREREVMSKLSDQLTDFLIAVEQV